MALARRFARSCVTSMLAPRAGVIQNMCMRALSTNASVGELVSALESEIEFEVRAPTVRVRRHNAVLLATSLLTPVASFSFY